MAGLELIFHHISEHQSAILVGCVVVVPVV
jgi:hypothetical protein